MKTVPLRVSIPCPGLLHDRARTKPRFPAPHVSLFQIIANAEVVGSNITQQLIMNNEMYKIL